MQNKRGFAKLAMYFFDTNSHVGVAWRYRRCVRGQKKQGKKAELTSLTKGVARGGYHPKTFFISMQETLVDCTYIIDITICKWVIHMLKKHTII